MKESSTCFKKFK